MSLRLIRASNPFLERSIIDIGGEASTLADCLLDDGYRSVAVLDLSGSALRFAQERLGSRSQCVEWFEADVTSFTPARQYHVWHDCAVFHFLVAETEREAYIAAMRRALVMGGDVIIATFAPDVPEKCSDLPVRRYDEAMIAAELGTDFQLESANREVHVTPWHSEQRFAYFHFKYLPGRA